jgi:hypothetical protein
VKIVQRVWHIEIVVRQSEQGKRVAGPFKQIKKVVRSPDFPADGRIVRDRVDICRSLPQAADSHLTNQVGY